MIVEVLVLFVILGLSAILFYWLDKRCVHKWKIYKELQFYRRACERPESMVCIMQCEKCGDLKSKKFD